MKLVIFAVLGLLLGVGGGSAMTVLKARKGFATFGAQRARIVADSIELASNHVGTPDSTVAPDSAGADSMSVAADSAQTVVASSPPTGRNTAGPSAHAAPAGHAETRASMTREPAADNKDATRPRALATVEAHGGTRPGSAVVPPKPIPGAKADTPSTGTVKLGKIFGAMPARDAAKVLEQLNDTEVHEILATLPAKLAGGIMQHLPPARAAAVSKLAMKGGAA